MPCTPSCATPRALSPSPQQQQIPQAVFVPIEEVRMRRAREAMCETCPFCASCEFCGPAGDAARRDPDQTCWAGRWPRADGTVVVNGVATVGVPFAVRLRLGVRAACRVLRHHLQTDGLYAGCGCFVRPLRVWHGLLGAMPSDRGLVATRQRVAGAIGRLRW